jgi:hypothetical protein
MDGMSEEHVNEVAGCMMHDASLGSVTCNCTIRIIQACGMHDASATDDCYITHIWAALLLKKMVKLINVVYAGARWLTVMADVRMNAISARLTSSGG